MIHLSEVRGSGTLIVLLSSSPLSIFRFSRVMQTINLFIFLFFQRSNPSLWQHLNFFRKSKSSLFGKSFAFIFQKLVIACQQQKLTLIHLRVFFKSDDLVEFPASVTLVDIYLSYLIQKVVSKSVFLDGFYAIKMGT